MHIIKSLTLRYILYLPQCSLSPVITPLPALYSTLLLCVKFYNCARTLPHSIIIIGGRGYRTLLVARVINSMREQLTYIPNGIRKKLGRVYPFVEPH